MAPITLVTVRGIMTRREMSRCLRYAPVLAVTPTQSATVLVAFAAMGAIPLNSRAGKAMKLPPPATALSAPPRAPATKRKRMVWSAKYQAYHTGRKKRRRQRYSGRLFVFRQPCQSFVAGLESGKLAAGEATQALSERMRKVLCSHPCGFLDMRLVKNGALFHGLNGFLVHGCSREIGQDQYRIARKRSHNFGNCPANLLDLSRRPVRKIH